MNKKRSFYSLSTPKCIEEFETASKFARDLTPAYKLCLQEAESGNLKAQRYLFNLLRLNIRELKQPTINTLLQAGKDSAPDIQNEIGLRFAKNTVEASYWYTLAAQKNYAPAQYNLGRLYKKGIGVTKEQAIKLFKQAAEKDYFPAKHALKKLTTKPPLTQPQLKQP